MESLTDFLALVIAESLSLVGMQLQPDYQLTCLDLMRSSLNLETGITFNIQKIVIQVTIVVTIKYLLPRRVAGRIRPAALYPLN